MKLKTIFSAALLSVAIFGASSAHAVSSYYTDLTSQFGHNTGCYVCHTGEMGDMLPFGVVFSQAAGGSAYQKIVNAGNVINPATGNTYGQDITTGGILPDTKTGGDDEDKEIGCMTSGVPTSLMMFFALMILGLFIRRGKQS